MPGFLISVFYNFYFSISAKPKKQQFLLMVFWTFAKIKKVGRKVFVKSAQKKRAEKCWQMFSVTNVWHLLKCWQSSTKENKMAVREIQSYQTGFKFLISGNWVRIVNKMAFKGGKKSYQTEFKWFYHKNPVKQFFL